ncbi:hypothetical protein [Burkholderia cepacia]|uniref:hypothetical protein n=1 Tax=Burkholderia cepacia TaxID=292 RepID=UPI001ABB7C18|nr:hypothetical protein [Burkholderia cepacia]HDR9079984.1 hypothetical protein [Burkholderia vietnamiensis]
MATKTCFVVMAIGDQEFNGVKISYSDLRKKYDGLIKEAILQARPDLEISRADDIAAPGTMTTDIITRIMHSDYVIADVTYPNPNVFYELGLRHACRAGTVILKDRSGPRVPFDIAHLRYIDYEDTGAGLKHLASTLSRTFDHLDRDPQRPDSHLLELAKLTGYEFPVYKKEDSPPEVRAIMSLFSNPEVMQMFIASTQGEETDPAELLQALSKTPDAMRSVLEVMVKTGALNFGPSGATKLIGEA